MKVEKSSWNTILTNKCQHLRIWCRKYWQRSFVQECCIPEEWNRWFYERGRVTCSFTCSSEVKLVKATEKLSINKIALLTFVNSVLGTVMKAEDDNNRMNKKGKELKTVNKLFQALCLWRGGKCIVARERQWAKGRFKKGDIWACLHVDRIKSAERNT